MKYNFPVEVQAKLNVVLGDFVNSPINDYQLKLIRDVCLEILRENIGVIMA